MYNDEKWEKKRQAILNNESLCEYYQNLKLSNLHDEYFSSLLPNGIGRIEGCGKHTGLMFKYFALYKVESDFNFPTLIPNSLTFEMPSGEKNHELSDEDIMAHAKTLAKEVCRVRTYMEKALKKFLDVGIYEAICGSEELSKMFKRAEKISRADGQKLYHFEFTDGELAILTDIATDIFEGLSINKSDCFSLRLVKTDVSTYNDHKLNIRDAIKNMSDEIAYLVFNDTHVLCANGFTGFRRSSDYVKNLVEDALNLEDE